MPATPELRHELQKLSPADRAELALFLIDSLEQGTDVDAEAAWREELLRRADEIQRCVAQGDDAHVVLERLRRKHS